MAETIPLAAVPNQVVTVPLGDQLCQIGVYQTLYGLFLDLYADNVVIIQGVICQNLNRIVRDLYLGFEGDLLFVDTQGSNDPDFTGLGPGGRYSLVYVSSTELPEGGVG